MKKSLLPIGLWSIVILTNAYFIYNFPLRHLNVESWTQPFGSLLITHILFGMVALLLGPLQFFASVRRSRPRLHRLTGRIYLLSILAGAICAIVLSIEHSIIIQKRIGFGTGTLGLAAAWLLTSAMALWAVKRRNFTQHREWMVRSYVVTCGFTVYRILFLVAMPYIMSGNAEYKNEISGVLAWSCWSLPLLVTEALLQVGKIRKQNSVTNSAVPRTVAEERVKVIGTAETANQQSTSVEP